MHTQMALEKDMLLIRERKALMGERTKIPIKFIIRTHRAVWLIYHL